VRAREVSAVGAATIGTGAVLTATVASACCVGPALAPILVSVLGSSGLAAVAGLRPYSPWLLLGSAAMLAFSFRQAYRKQPCAEVGVRFPVPRGVRFARVVLGAAGVLWLISGAYAAYGMLQQ